MLKTPLVWASVKLLKAERKYLHERNDALYVGIAGVIASLALVFFGLFSRMLYVTVVSMGTVPWLCLIQLMRYYSYVRMFELVFYVQLGLCAFFSVNMVLWWSVEWINNPVWFYVLVGLILVCQCFLQLIGAVVARNMEHAYRCYLQVLTLFMTLGKAANDPELMKLLSPQARQLALFYTVEPEPPSVDGSQQHQRHRLDFAASETTDKDL